MSDHGIAGDRLGHQHGRESRARFQQPLDATVLVAEHDLQKQHLLTVRLKPEVPGLDDAGVDGTDGDLMYLLAAHLKEWVGLPVERPEVARQSGVIRWVPPNRLEPRMPGGYDGALLGNLALEEVRLETIRRERRIGIRDNRGTGPKHARLVVREDGEELGVTGRLGHAEERDQAPPRRDTIDHPLAEPVYRLAGYGRQRHRTSIP
jgi:hypothetical protein